MKLNRLICSASLLVLMLSIITYIPVTIANAEEVDYGLKRYLYTWTYLGDAVIAVPQTIEISVGCGYDLVNGDMEVNRTFLDGTAHEGAAPDWPFEETIFLNYVKWYVDGSLYTTLEDFDSVPVISDPDDVYEYGENYEPITINLQYETWSQKGQIEVYAPETLEMWKLFNVTNS